jgi:hypothetical protein
VFPVEEAVVAALRSAGLACYADVPRDRPAEFATVERTGGGVSGSDQLDAPQVAVRSWAETRARAAELSREVDAAVLAMDSDDRVLEVSRNASYWYPDESAPRYQTVYDFVCYDE